MREKKRKLKFWGDPNGWGNIAKPTRALVEGLNGSSFQVVDTHILATGDFLNTLICFPAIISEIDMIGLDSRE